MQYHIIIHVHRYSDIINDAIILTSLQHNNKHTIIRHIHQLPYQLSIKTYIFSSAMALLQIYNSTRNVLLHTQFICSSNSIIIITALSSYRITTILHYIPLHKLLTLPPHFHSVYIHLPWK